MTLHSPHGKMQETDCLQFCWVHILTIERSTCATVLWPNMEQLHIEGEKERKKIQFPVWITLLLTLCVWPHVHHGPCFCVYILCGKDDKYVTLLLKGHLGRLSKTCWRHTSTLTQTMTYDAPTPQFWLNLNKFDEVSTAPGKYISHKCSFCVCVCVCVLPPNYQYPSPIFKCLFYTAL